MKVEKMTLYTMSACPLGRTMKHVLEEVTTRLSHLTFSIVFIDLEPELTNKSGISSNPTTLLQSKKGKELSRIEGFKETEKVIGIIKRVESSDLVLKQNTVVKKGKNVEKYTIHLLNGKVLEPIDIEFTNSTAVKTPRITAITLLLQADHPAYVNPFPPNVTLELVKFDGEMARIFLKNLSEDVSSDCLTKMESCLKKTLEPYGINKIQIIKIKD